jgi:DNA-binding MarR family transcriptional regulator
MGATNAMFVHAVAAQLGLNPTDFESMDVLDWTGPIPAGRLAELTGLSTGAISGILDRLEAGGWIARTRDPHDGRKVIVSLVPERVTDIAPLYAGVASGIDQLVSELSDAELAIIVDVLSRLNDIFLEETLHLRARRRAGLAQPGGRGTPPPRLRS